MPDEQATKADLLDLELVIRGAIQDSETRILKAIYGYTETITARQNSGTKRLAEFEERLVITERRLLEVEKRLNLPPAA